MLRRDLSHTTRGLCGQNVSVYHCSDNAKAIALQRWDQQDPKDSVVVAVNVNDKNHENYVIGFPRPGVWKTRFNSDSYN